MNTEKKKFNWGKAIIIFFTVVLILRALVWIFGNNAPSCTSKETKQKYANLIHRKMQKPEYEGLGVSITNHKEFSSSKDSRVCEADVEFYDATGASESFKGAYEIKKKGDKYVIQVN